MNELPKEGTFWKHVKTQRVYRVLCSASIEPRYIRNARELTQPYFIKLIIHQNIETSEVYARPVYEFSDGRFVQVDPPLSACNLRQESLADSAGG